MCFNRYSKHLNINKDIQFYETEAVLGALALWQEELRGRRILIFVDNTSSQGGICKGYSKNDSVTGLVTEIWHLLSSIQASPWVERVVSEMNIADGPSRGNFEEALKHGFKIQEREF